MRRALAAIFCALSCAAPLRAQDAPAEDLAPLREHYRPALHPGDPLRLVGLEQDGNELRAKTPVLALGEHEPLLLDSEANYRRALALYGGTLYHVPLAAAAASASKPAGRRHYVDPEPEPEARGPAATPWSVLAGLSVSVLLLVWYFVRVRPALIAPYELLEAAPQAADPAAISEEFVFRPTRRAQAPLRFTHEAPPSPLPQRPSGSVDDARTPKPPQRR